MGLHKNGLILGHHGDSQEVRVLRAYKILLDLGQEIQNGIHQTLILGIIICMNNSQSK